MTEAERKIIIENLPEGFSWNDVSYTRLGSFSQLLFKGELVGYILHKEVPEWKGKGARKN